MKSEETMKNYCLVLLMGALGAGMLPGAEVAFIVDACNGRSARFDKTVLLENNAELEAAVAAGVKSFVVEELADGNRTVPVEAALDRSGERPMLAWTMPGATSPLQVRSFRIRGNADGTEGVAGRTDLSCRVEDGKIVVGTRYFEVVHLERGKGGQPVSVLDRASGTVEDELFFNDRTFSKKLGQFRSWQDAAATARVVFKSPLMVVVEARTKYVDGAQRPSPDGLGAVYRYVYLANSPVVEVRARVERGAEKSVDWDELHFLELSTWRDRFDRFLLGPNGDLKSVGTKDGKPQMWYPKDWGVMMGGGLAVGVGGGWPACFDNADHSFCRYVSSANGPMAKDQLTRRFEGAVYYGPLLEASAWYAGQLGARRQPRLRVRGGKPAPVVARAPQALGGPTLATAGGVLAFAGAEAGFACAELREQSTGVTFFRAHDGCPGLWRLVFRAGCGGAETVLDNRNAKRGVAEKTERGLRFVWKNLDLAEEHGVVDVVCEVDREGDGFAFRIQVANRSKKCGLARTDYPLLGEVIPPGTGESLVPYWSNWGPKLMRNRRDEVRQNYPSTGGTMQFMAFHQGGAGVYVGCHDGGASPKWLHVTAGNDVAFEVPSENAGVSGAAGAPKFATVVAPYRGDWWQAAARYREWAMQQKWTAKGPIVARSDYPRRLVENGFWLQLGGSPAEIERAVDQTLARMTNAVPFGVHWYCWHQIPFDNSYPEYFPAKPGFAEAVKRMTAKGVLIMPYINGRLWDRDIASFQGARPFATKRPNGEPRYETYGSGRWLAAMCPATQYWGDRVASICTRLVAEGGVNAIYLDQIGAAPVSPCYDPAHGHPLDGGSHWVDGYRRLLTPIKAQVRGTVLTTEDFAEPYMDNIDAFLTWLANSDADVPVVAAVYSGYTACFASPGAPADTPSAFRASVLRDTMWGCQPGWMGTWILDEKHREQFDALVACGELRRKYREFLSEGRLMGEVVNEADESPFTVVWNYKGLAQEVTLAPVMALVWENAKGRRITLVANLSDERRRFVGTPAGGQRIECELAPGEVRGFSLTAKTGF